MLIVDSSYFIALADARDQWHDKAAELKKVVEKDDVMITNLIVSEVLTELGRRKGWKPGHLLYNYFKDNCKILYPDEDDFDNAEEIYLKYDGKLSISDSLSVFYMNKLTISKIVSFDSDFDKVMNIKRVFNHDG